MRARGDTERRARMVRCKNALLLFFYNKQDTIFYDSDDIFCFRTFHSLLQICDKKERNEDPEAAEDDGLHVGRFGQGGWWTVRGAREGEDAWDV